MESTSRFQNQRKTRQKNEKKILDALRESGHLTFTELLRKTNLSRPVLSTHLKRMRGEGRISKGLSGGMVPTRRRAMPDLRAIGASYYISSPKLRKAQWFASAELPYILQPYEIVDGEKWDDTELFDDDEEVADGLLETISGLVFFIMGKLVQAHQRGDEEEVNHLVEIVLPALPVRIDQEITGFFEGYRWVADEKTKSRITRYYEFDNLPREEFEKRAKSRQELLLRKINEKYDKEFREWLEEKYEKGYQSLDQAE
ncbi:MAG: winged helix-turn-helix domain-containing protein [Candidatus Freyarchaeota archaeon]